RCQGKRSRWCGGYCSRPTSSTDGASTSAGLRGHRTSPSAGGWAPRRRPSLHLPTPELLRLRRCRSLDLLYPLLQAVAGWPDPLRAWSMGPRLMLFAGAPRTALVTGLCSAPQLVATVDLRPAGRGPLLRRHGGSGSGGGRREQQQGNRLTPSGHGGLGRWVVPPVAGLRQRLGSCRRLVGECRRARAARMRWNRAVEERGGGENDMWGSRGPHLFYNFYVKLTCGSREVY
ncbi:Os08g0114000, partial [Oryza sativa Japonica Group]